ncbi:MAG: methyltransferase domain-containing protein [Oculatellaceae cyanobacterium bins.114]|nr:methyltransferase domain-containing protein [Oculatellaceae cyanobacterium bins.114]
MTNTTYKDQVVTSFSHATSTYNTHAIVQQQCAQELISLLRSRQKQLPEGPVLEIGCGTGFVTQELIHHCGDRPLKITDISASMLEVCQQNLHLTTKQQQRISFQQMDGEAYNSDEAAYAIVVSNFVVQWFEQPIQSLQKLIAALKPSGLLLVTFPTHHSFPEWQQICKQINLPFTGNPLPNPHYLIQKLTQKSVNCVWYEKEISTVYTHAIDFFKSLKLIGAGLNRCHQKLSPIQMKQLIRHWDQQHPEGIQIHYHIAFLMIQQTE